MCVRERERNDKVLNKARQVVLKGVLNFALEARFQGCKCPRKVCDGVPGGNWPRHFQRYPLRERT